MDIKKRKSELLESLVKEDSNDNDKISNIIKAFNKVGLKGIDKKSIKISDNYKPSEVYEARYASTGGLFSISTMLNLDKALKSIGAKFYSFYPVGTNQLYFFINFN